MGRLAASLLGADPLNLERDMREALDAGVEILHIDAMDAHFAPNLAFGPDTVRRIRDATDATLDVHLMLDEFDRYLDRYVEAGADWLTVHLEAGLHHHRHLVRIRDAGRRAGLALNPGTPVDAIADLRDVIDVLLVMSVDPGYAGASFIPGAVEKVEKADALRRGSGASFEIAVDGGVDEANIAQLAQAGADVFVTASALFGRGPIRERARALAEAMGG
jgi:ribulose-phosphate 3-epimerase